MKVNQVISSIDISTGGPARSVTHLIESLLKESSTMEVNLETLKTTHPIITNFQNKRGKLNFNDSVLFQYSKQLKLNLQTSNVDLFHGHGLWQLPVHQMSEIAIETGVPYIITIRGMLEPWSLSQGKIKKKIALQLFQKKDLENASCIHVTAKMELESIRNLGFRNPIAVIPNGININEFPVRVPKKLDTPKKILFLSRIHKKKGIENLIDSWILLKPEIRKNWIIDIVGNGDEKYINFLREKIISENLGSQIKIKKPVFGKNKALLYNEASLFVLPTYSENFGIVIAEALASFTPVITTKGAPWKDLENEKCGWWIDIGVEPLRASLEKAMQISSKDLIEMGKNGRKLIEKKYSMESVAKKMILLYDWVLTKNQKPDFIEVL